jgi:hypothetical protein
MEGELFSAVRSNLGALYAQRFVILCPLLDRLAQSLVELLGRLGSSDCSLLELDELHQLNCVLGNLNNTRPVALHEETVV